MRLALAIVLLPALALGQQPSRNFNRNAGTRAGNVAFRFLPAGGAGAPAVATNFVPASELTGNWFELTGDGTVRSGSLALTATGTAAVRTLGVCPNGVNCTPASALAFNGGVISTDFYESAAVATPTDLSCWMLFRADVTGLTRFALGKGDTSGTGKAFDIYLFGASMGSDIYSADATFTSGTAATVVPGAWHLFVATYNYVSDGASIFRTYMDGTQTGAVLTAHGPLQAKSNTWQVGGWKPDTANRFPGAIRSAGCTEKVLSAATITAMANSAQGLPISGSGGEALTFTRASAKSCVANDGTVNMLPNARVCLANGGYVSEVAATDLILRSDALDNAAWFKDGIVVAAPTVTANSTDVVAPDGSNNAEKVAYPAVLNATEVSYVDQAITGTAAAYSNSVWLRTLSGSATTYLMMTTGAAWFVQACAVTTTWSRCKLENKTLTAVAWTMAIGTDLRAGASAAGTAATTAQTIYVWGAQFELGSFATSYIPTTSAAVARVVDALTVSSPAVIGLTPSFSADVVLASGAPANGYWLSEVATAADDWELYVSAVPDFRAAASVTSVLKGPVIQTGTITVGTSLHLSANYNGATLNSCRASVCTGSALAFTPLTSFTTVGIGSYKGISNTFPGTISNVCIGRTPAACP